MGLSIYNIKRWMRMMTGRSIYHVEQGVGKAIDKGGYYNDLTQKVLMGASNLDDNGIPFLEHSDGSHIQMPTMIFQYGLGAYDLYLLEGKIEYLNKAVKCANWAIEHQNNDGSWSTFFYIYPENPYSAMPQGEAASLLVRVYGATKDNQYLIAAKKAIDFMLLSVSKGGVSKDVDGGLVLLEYTHLPIVLNGWIFAAWGIYDLSCLIEEYRNHFERTVITMIRDLSSFDNGYWSLYDMGGMITSPFYHNLHIAQMKAMFMLTGAPEFEQYGLLFEKYEVNLGNRMKAFAVKAVQKLKER